MATTKRKPKQATEPEQLGEAQTPKAATDAGILANDHDVDELGEDIQKLLAGLCGNCHN